MLLQKVGFSMTDKCPCGKRQAMLYIVSSCPQTKLEDGLQWIHLADDVAVQWLIAYGSRMHMTTT